MIDHENHPLSNEGQPSRHRLILGASQGIGLALVNHQLSHYPDVQVVACSRHAAQSEALTRLLDQYPRRLEIFDVDVTDETSLASFARDLGPKRFELIVNATGILHDETREVWPEKRVEDLTAQSFETVMRVNAWGNALLLKVLLPYVDRRSPCIWAALSAKVGSIEDNRMGGWYSYRASKAALNQILKTASIEAKRRYPSLIVVALHPGTTDTQLSKPFQGNVPPDKLFAPDFVAHKLMEVLKNLTPEDSGRFFAWDGQAIPY